jgi:hypothetical protein
MRITSVLLLGVVQLYAIDKEPLTPHGKLDSSYVTDPRIGTWQEISFEERPITRLTITAQPNGMHLVIAGDAGGVLEFTAKFDERNYPVLHTVAVNQISLRKENASTIVATFKRDGRATGGVRRYEATGDGKELVCTDTVTGQDDKYSIVFDRKGGPRDTANLAVGSWIINHAKTVQRNPEVIKFTADGPNGVGFDGSAGFGYNAQFDGKDYPTQQSRDDAVTLKLLDPRTVQEIWKRDGKVANSVRFVISMDGQQLTRTSEGLQTDGKRYKSKEVYRKQ